MGAGGTAPDLAASVVIPTHGRRESLLRVLRALDRQRIPAGSFEVIVVCDGDVDGTASACRVADARLSYNLTVVEQTNEGRAIARNRGMRRAHAPLLIFLDDDIVADEALIAAHLAAHREQVNRVALGPALPPPDLEMNIWSAWEADLLCRLYDRLVSGREKLAPRHFYTGNASVLKQHLDEIGGFDEALRRGEDVDLGWRLGQRGLEFVFVPDAKAWHYSIRTFKSWLRLPTTYGEIDVEMAQRSDPDVLAFLARWYRERHILVRAAVELCTGRRYLRRPFLMLLGALTRAADAADAPSIGYPLCSLLYNVLYWESLAESLGGRAAFRRLLARQPVNTQRQTEGGARTPTSA